MGVRRNLAVLLVITCATTLPVTGCNLPGIQRSGEKSPGQELSQPSETPIGKPKLIFFTQPGCPPCGPVGVLVKELSKEMGDTVFFETVDISENFEPAERYNIQATPTVVILDAQGNEVKRFVGIVEKDELKSALESAM